MKARFVGLVLTLTLILFTLSAAEIGLADDSLVVEGELDRESQIVESVECELGKDKREIEAVTHWAGCRLRYTKFGKTRVVASSRHGVDLCQTNLEKIQKNLEEADYVCE